MIKFRTLRADEVDARVGTCNEKGFSLLLYKDARCDQNILDETVGAEKWQRRHYEVKSNMFCSVGIYSDERNEWIWKDDCGVESQTEKEKGEASDSFKRACFNWGIGRELYTAPFIYIKGHTMQNAKGKFVPDIKNFVVKVLECENGKISKLQILGDKEVIFEFGMRGITSANKSKDCENDVANNSTAITLEEAKKMRTKSGTPFDKLSDEYLLKILDSNANEQSKAAVRLILAERNDADMKPVDEEDLPF